jgi:hypothetical protein
LLGCVCGADQRFPQFGLPGFTDKKHWQTWSLTLSFRDWSPVNNKDRNRTMASKPAQITCGDGSAPPSRIAPQSGCSRCQRTAAITAPTSFASSRRPFADVRAALERSVPHLDPGLVKALDDGDVARANREKEQRPELSIFLVRDHGALLKIAGKTRNALQYDIGNPLTASLPPMRRLQLLATARPQNRQQHLQCLVTRDLLNKSS